MPGNAGNDRDFKRGASKAILPTIAAVAFTLAGLIGTGVLTTLKELESSVEQLKIDVAVIKTDIQYMKLRQSAGRE